ncbi:MAG TPA: hypothetical protein VMR75_04140 [Candidatus Saccharimonadales bacterium]|nr:hypothetical protein [Candidatus Saccharimonadales bacterium]
MSLLVKSYIGTVSLVGSAALVLALIVMRLTTPLTIGPLGVTAWFVLVLAGFSGVAAALFYMVAAVLSRSNSATTPLTSRRRITDSGRRGLLVGSYLAILLALSSLQQLNLRDAILLVLLFGLVEFYMVARRGH